MLVIGGKAAVLAGNAIIVEDGTLPPAYRRLAGITFDGGVFFDTGMRLQGSDTVKIAFNVSKACNILGCYTTTTADDNYSLYLSTSGTAKYMRYGSGTYNSVFSANARYDVTITPKGTRGFQTDSTWTPRDFTTSVDMLIGSTSYGASSAKLTGDVYGAIEVVNKRRYIPVERIADGEIGYYDIFTETFLENQGTGTPIGIELND